MKPAAAKPSREDKSTIEKLTNGKAHSSSWDKLETASGTVYFGSRGPKTPWKIAGKPEPLVRNYSERHVSELTSPQLEEHVKIRQPKHTAQSRPQKKELR